MFYLIGHPLGHSLSPFIHTELAKIQGISIEYTLYDILPGGIDKSLGLLKNSQGFNVTIPHKTGIIPFLSHIDTTAENIGAVNTVKSKNGLLYGYNTDCVGFIRALEKCGMNLSGKVLICGTGGVSRMMAFEAAKRGCNITIASRDSNSCKPVSLKNELNSRFGKGIGISLVDYGSIVGDFDILLNGTPCGMFPNTGSIPVSENVILRCSSVFDTVYNPFKTKLVEFAEKNNIPACGGLSMLVGQAAIAQEIWFDAKFSDKQLDTVIEKANEELFNFKFK